MKSRIIHLKIYLSHIKFYLRAKDLVMLGTFSSFETKSQNYEEMSDVLNGDNYHRNSTNRKS